MSDRYQHLLQSLGPRFFLNLIGVDAMQQDQGQLLDQQVLGNGPAFNGSLIRFHDELVLVYRYRDRGSRLHVAILDPATLAPMNVMPLQLKHSGCRFSQEDPRLFIHDDVLHLAFGGIESFVVGRHMRTNALWTRLDEQFQAGEIVCPSYHARTDMEKNWQWFSSHDNQIRAVYSISPWIVVDDLGRELIRHEWQPRWKGGHLRGGASPVRVGDEFWCFFHGALDRTWQAPWTRQRYYSVGLMTFDAQTLLPSRIIPEPLLWGVWPRMSTSLLKWIVFPCGAFRDGNEWVLSGGTADADIRVWRMGHASLESSLEAV